MTISKNIYTRRMISAIVVFTRELEKYPGWREWNRGKVAYTLHFDEFVRYRSHEQEFKFDEETEKQHTIIMRYFSLTQTSAELRDLEVYFRRFPYSGTPITRYGHLSNCCELYFSKFYQYKERLKKLFDAVGHAIGKSDLDVGKLIKLLDKEFEAEMRERHSIHHRQRFEDAEISRVFLIESIISSDPAMADKGWADEQRRAYRKAGKIWAKRCLTQSGRLDEFTEVVARELLKTCPFLMPEFD